MGASLKLARYIASLNRSVGKRDTLRDQKTTYDLEMTRLTALRNAIEKAQALIQTVALETQEVLKIQIQDIVQSAFDTVFPGVYEFSVIFEIKRNRTEARLVFKQKGYEVDIVSSDGGGLVDLASFALRVAAWSLGTSADVMLLDEPGKWVSRDLVGAFAEIVTELSQKLNLQVIMVSHVPELIENSEKVFRVVLENKEGFSISKVQEV
jgi:DNA repair exonuclease SbcCD ATPase subunit